MIKKMKLIVTMMLIMWVTTVVIMIWELSVTQFEANPSAIKLLEIDFLKIPIPLRQNMWSNAPPNFCNKQNN